MQQICNYSMMTLSPHWVSTSLDYSQEARLKISHKYLGPYVKQYSVRVGAQGHDEALLAMGRSSTGPETCLPFTAWATPTSLPLSTSLSFHLCNCVHHFRAAHFLLLHYMCKEAPLPLPPGCILFIVLQVSCKVPALSPLFFICMHLLSLKDALNC